MGLPHGVVVPLLTPLLSGGEVDGASLERLVVRSLEAGALGFWVCGTSGEFYALDADQRADAVAIVAAASRRVDTAEETVVIAHVGDTSTRVTLTNTERAMAAGATHIAVALPFYLEWTYEELATHLRAVSGQLNAPVLHYQHPASRPNVLTEEQIIGLTRDGVLCGMKDSYNDPPFVGRMVRAAESRGLSFSCLHGAGDSSLAALQLGASGIVSIISNLVPEACVGMVQQSRGGRDEDAQLFQEQLRAVAQAIRDALPGRRNWAPTVAAYKHLLLRLGLFETSEVLGPLLPLSDEELGLLDETVLPMVQRLCGQRPALSDPPRGSS